MCVKVKFSGGFNIGFLQAVLLGLTVIAFFFFLSLLYLFHKVAMAITMQPGTIFINTKVLRNIFLVHLEPGIH